MTVTQAEDAISAQAIEIFTPFMVGNPASFGAHFHPETGEGHQPRQPWVDVIGCLIDDRLIEFVVRTQNNS
jgi:hypothetical protein